MKVKTVSDTLVNLFQMATAEEIIDGETNKPITLNKFQRMIKGEVLDLSKVLGLEIEGKEDK